jgi:hypothetical protein
MKFFSKLRKAKGAAEEYKKAAAAQEEPKPRVPYKHIPTHAAQDALASAPTYVGTVNLQARIAEAKRSVPPTPTLARSRSMQSMRSYPASSSRPSSSSAHASPSHSRASSFGGRSSSDLSAARLLIPILQAHPVSTFSLPTKGVPDQQQPIFYESKEEEPACDRVDQ